MEVRDGRHGKFSLDENGFIFVEHKTAVRDFFEPSELKRVYYPEVEPLIKKVSGAKRVHVFDHTLRSGDEAEREAKLIREPVLSAHNDYTEWSGPHRVRELLPDESRSAAQAPLRDHPGVARDQPADPVQPARDRRCEAASRAEDLLDRRAPLPASRRADLPPEVQPARTAGSTSRSMRRDEALVFKVYDSAKDGRARFTPHTSFDDPATPPGAPPRQSIEARALVFF